MSAVECHSPSAPRAAADNAQANLAAGEFMNDLSALAHRALELAGQRKLSIVTAESCTAGKLSALLSEAPGAAECLHGSFVTYTKANKHHALGISTRLLAHQGAVCRDVAVAMARGALARSPADLAVSITGVAGPEPDEDGNPVGRVCIGLAQAGMTRALEYNYGDIGREAVQSRAMADALNLLIDTIDAGRANGTHSARHTDL